MRNVNSIVIYRMSQLGHKGVENHKKSSSNGKMHEFTLRVRQSATYWQKFLRTSEHELEDLNFSASERELGSFEFLASERASSPARS